MIMERLRTFYAADAFVLIMPDHGVAGYHPSRANRQDPAKEVHAEVIPEELAHELLALPSRHVVISWGQRRAWQLWYPEASVLAYDLRGCLMRCNPGQAANPDRDHGHPDHRRTRVGAVRVIFAHAAVALAPAEGPFHDPPPGARLAYRRGDDGCGL